jgi:hypothetical protein
MPSPTPLLRVLTVFHFLAIGTANTSAAPAGSTPAAPAAEVLSVKNGEVVVRRDGKTYSLDQSALTPAEQAAALAWKPATVQAQDGPATTDSDLEIKITVDSAITPATDSPTPAQVLPKVNLVNKETMVNFKGLQGTLILVGEQPIPGSRVKVLAVQKFSADLAATGNFDFAGPATAATTPSQRANLPAFQYQGYIFVLQNAEGNIIQFRSSGRFLRSGQQALKLKVGSLFTALRPLGNNVRRPASTVKPASAGQP